MAKKLSFESGEPFAQIVGLFDDDDLILVEAHVFCLDEVHLPLDNQSSHDQENGHRELGYDKDIAKQGFLVASGSWPCRW